VTRESRRKRPPISRSDFYGFDYLKLSSGKWNTITTKIMSSGLTNSMSGSSRRISGILVERMMRIVCIFRIDLLLPCLMAGRFRIGLLSDAQPAEERNSAIPGKELMSDCQFSCERKTFRSLQSVRFVPRRSCRGTAPNRAPYFLS
jgi:hypothetical protein